MAKKFHFDDEFEDDIVEKQEEKIPKSKVDSLYSSKEEPYVEKKEDTKIDLIFSKFNDEKTVDDTIPFVNAHSLDDEEIEEDEDEDIMVTKKKKLKAWHIVLIVFVLIIALFFGYIYFLTNTDGPVFGNRCEGVTSINIDARKNTISKMKSKYSQIKDLTIEIVCKEIKVDIVFKDNMDKDKAKKIAEETVKTLDTNVGLSKDDGKTYSQLFGYIKNEAQYDCQLYLVSNKAKDFPIYGTKHHIKDKFSYTYASVKDKESKEKAEKTLEKK